MNESNHVYDIIREDISNADMILIGLGSEFSTLKKSQIQSTEFYIKHKSRYQDSEIENLLDIAKYQYSKDQGETISLYNKLNELIKDKNYFVITTNYDEVIYQSNLNSDRIVAPCGKQFHFQCDCGNENNIVDGKDIYENFLRLIENDNQLETIEMQKPVCKYCNKTMVPNTYKCENYDESGYGEQWEKYQLWLQGTLNKKLIVLELGEGFQIPDVMRWPFERIAFLNNQAKLYRINDTFPQLDKSLGDKGISMHMSAKELLKNLVVY